MSKSDIKQPTICVYSSGRSGSNYLLHYLKSDSRYISMGEPFTIDNLWNRSIFIGYCGRMLRSKKINEEQYLHILQGCVSHETKGPSDISKIKECIKIENLLSMIIDIEKSKNVSKGIIFKYMPWYEPFIGLDFPNISNQVDYLIYNYRKNTLKQWISQSKALITQEWLTYNESKAINMKVQWDKQKYIGFATEAKNTHNKAIQHFVQFDGPKAMICYEEISENNENTIAFLNKTLEISKIDCHIGTPQLPIKQSSDISLEHNFTNPEEFLQDINTINDLIFLRKPDGI